MAAWTYDEALRRLLAHEGGYTNHPSDPGGPTNFGITIYDYRKYVKPNATAADVRAMTVGEAKAIYRKRYWDAQRCDELPAGVDYAVFDYGVNSGIGRSRKVLQPRGGLTADGVLGPLDEVLAPSPARDPEEDRDGDLRRAPRLPQAPEDLAGVRQRLGARASRRCSSVSLRMATATGPSPSIIPDPALRSPARARCRLRQPQRR